MSYRSGGAIVAAVLAAVGIERQSWRSEPAEGQLAHRRVRQGAHVVAAQRDAARPGHRGAHEAAVESAAGQPAAPDAQPLSGAHRQRRRDRARTPRSSAIVAGVSDNIYGIDVETGTQIWKRQFDSTFKDDGSTRCVRAVPRRADRDADHRARGDAGEVHGLRDLVGRPAANARRRHGRGDVARRAVPAGQRQAVRPELLRQRPLHDDRAGLRRQPEPVLLVRPGDEEGRAASIRAAAGCGRGSARPSARTVACMPEAATATTFRSGGSSARRSSRPS